MVPELGITASSLILALSLANPSVLIAEESPAKVNITQEISPNKINTFSLDFRQTSFSHVLQIVSKRSGVTFSVDDALGDQLINQKISGNDWNSAIKALLQDYSYLGIVDRSKSFRRIIVTGLSGNGSDSKQISRPVGELGPGTDALDVPLSETPILLWQASPGGNNTRLKQSGIPTRFIQTLPDALNQIRVGQPLEIQIPQEEFPLFGVVGSEHSELNGRVSVWSGPIDAFHETASFTVTRGNKLTFVTVATGISIYEISIDNATGLGTVVNGLDLVRGKDENDAIIPPLVAPGV